MIQVYNSLAPKTGLVLGWLYLQALSHYVQIYFPIMVTEYAVVYMLFTNTLTHE